MTYDDVYKLIGRYCNEVLPLYADRWSRFPVSRNAVTVADRLDAAATSWAATDPGVSTALADAAREIRNRSVE